MLNSSRGWARNSRPTAEIRHGGRRIRPRTRREFIRLGSSRTQETNVRIIAATNVDIEKAAYEGRFRRDLYLRLNVIRVQVPRLADRRDDIPLLMTSFMKKHGQIRSGPYPPVRGVTPEVLQIFMSYEWPGNVRELGNVIESAIALGTSEYITLEDVPPSLLGGSQPMELSSWDKEVAACKKSIMEKALRKTTGNRAEAGRMLGPHPTYFSKICKEPDEPGRTE